MFPLLLQVLVVIGILGRSRHRVTPSGIIVKADIFPLTVLINSGHPELLRITRDAAALCIRGFNALREGMLV